MIDEKRLIEDIEDDAKRILSRVFGEVPSEFIDHYLKEMKELVNDQQKINEWIPCSEGLPKDNEMSEYYDAVIVTLDDGRVVNGCYRNRDEEWWVDAEDGEKYSINVTGHVIAWMPLPEAYKGQ